jgi:F-type H+-transporting ATPase subunit gamma
METIESLRKRIKSAHDLQSLVKTMKALAAVSIRQYESAVASISQYDRTVEMGLQVVLQMHRGRIAFPKGAGDGFLNVVVFGSDQGMCGPLNDQIVSHALKSMDEMGVDNDRRSVFAVGARTASRLEDAGQRVSAYFPAPIAASGIAQKVQEILVSMEEWRGRQGFDRLALFYCRPLSGASYSPHTQYLLPLHEEGLRKLRQKKWPTRMLPAFTMEWEKLFAALVREYLFASLCRALAESSASEHAGRLAAMQNAEKNIEERLNELTGRYYQQRQASITEELLDIISGFEALQQ